jgi:trans-AT polyketide synthase/acyltransferase/oxidoreductase domain-containing protein
MNVLLFPGQGAQYKGMGEGLWEAYPQLADMASNVLGYSLKDLCLDDPQHRLRLTQYTQPALYVVHALHYARWQEEGGRVDAAAGHSLGEYAALHAAGSFDFETGLRLVQQRGQLMSEAGGGIMAAVLGMRADALQALLQEHGLDCIDLANVNSPTQSVIAGPLEAINAAEKLLIARNLRCIVLNVSAPFHSHYMRTAQQAFGAFLQDFDLKDPTFPVIANTTARPYGLGEIKLLLTQQIASSVRWVDTIRYLMGRGNFVYCEMGADLNRTGGVVLGKFVDEIRRTETPLQESVATTQSTRTQSSAVITTSASQRVPLSMVPPPTAPITSRLASTLTGTMAGTDAQKLGSAAFRARYGVCYAYVAGAMFRGTGSAALVIRMGQAGLLAYLGAGGLSLDEIEVALQTIQAQLIHGEAYGANLLADYDQPKSEHAVVELYLRYRVTNIEAAAFMQLTTALVLFRVKGLSQDAQGRIRCAHRVLAKVSRLEVAEAFMSPPPRHLVEILLREGAITAEQAELAKQVPMSHDLCVEADSGGHTDGGIPTILLPAMLRLRDRIQVQHRYAEPLCMGLGGGIGTPAAAAAAFAMDADFILTGSINQCTVEAGASDIVKGMLQDAGIHDMTYAPAGDMFELGARVQVLKKGLLFPMRANKLYALYQQHDSWEAIPEAERSKIERMFFKRSFLQVWEECRRDLQIQGCDKDLAIAQSNPKVRMARVFRWYLAYTVKLAFSDCPDDQVHTGPALGAFNQWVKGTPLEPWQARHVDAIALHLLEATAAHVHRRERARATPEPAVSEAVA